MGAAQAAIQNRRKPAGSESETYVLIPDDVKKCGWTAIPNSYFDDVFPVLNARGHMTAFGLLGVILRATIGGRIVDGMRPEWVTFRKADMARMTNSTIEGVGKAIETLLEYNYIERIEEGRGYKYRALVENFTLHSKPQPRKLSAAAPQHLPGWKTAKVLEASVEDEPVLVEAYRAPSPPKRIVKDDGVPILVVLPGHPQPLPLAEVCPNAARCELIKKYTNVENKGDAKPIQVLEYMYREPEPGEIQVPEYMYPRQEPGKLSVLEYGYPEFLAYLEQRFSIKIGSRPGDQEPLVRQAFNQLAGAGVMLKDFVDRLDQRQASFKKWGFVQNLADDVIKLQPLLEKQRKADNDRLQEVARSRSAQRERELEQWRQRFRAGQLDEFEIKHIRRYEPELAKELFG